MTLNQLKCPHCHATIGLSPNGNVLDTPLTCQACGQTFHPHFYCPDAQSASRHTFEATALYLDNLGQVYTFCPDHTFTTYALVMADKTQPQKPQLVQTLTHFFSSLTFRLALFMEGLRRRVFSRQ